MCEEYRSLEGNVYGNLLDAERDIENCGLVIEESRNDYIRASYTDPDTDNRTDVMFLLRGTRTAIIVNYIEEE